MTLLLYVLLGIGLIAIMLSGLSFWLSKRKHQEIIGSDAVSSVGHLEPSNLDRTSMETTLKRFVQQVKRENEELADKLYATIEQLGINQQELSASNQLHEQNNHNMQQEIDKLSQQLLELQKSHLILKKSVEQSQTLNQNSANQLPEISQDVLALKDRYQRVFELVQQGLTTPEIAKKLGAGHGEIELILTLAEPIEREA
ncbi:hypothetical protein EEL32_11100 [Brevibacillus laterosporus]|uniref:Uncharacterized protein n=1 Tax=Brevibacillus laterosporus TaxID=1465 RepID=A0A502INN5_BRELA|nr:hypothetical protein [Brevibacillus laterosporus]QDX94970.1 hypothetical protein EEL30_23390 [Brevibacillus laterosporus]TPG68834.1 hypothetical protein EEL31_10055 [Brevibacillus laterosporus]TPG87955.1 hypothetical protein EEL32_11100 [Brevibacillus laterosporus]